MLTRAVPAITTGQAPPYGRGKLAGLVSISSWIRDPAIDRRLPPPRAVSADLDLFRERAFADLPIEGRSTKARARKHGLEADYPVEVGHRYKLHTLGSQGI